MKCQVKRVIYEEIEIDEDETMTLMDAAKELGITEPGIYNAIKRGSLSEIIVPGVAKHRGSHRVLRKEVEQLKHRKN